MERFLINNVSEISDVMYEKIEDGYEDVEFIGFYEDAIVVIKGLLSYDDTEVYQVEIEPEEYDGYDKEYIVSIDSERGIWCEKAYQYEHNRYLECYSNCTFIADDCNSAILNKIESDEIYEVSYEVEEEMFNSVRESKSESSHISRDKDGKITGFIKSWSNTDLDGTTHYSSCSYYGNNEDIVKMLAKEFKIEI
jgi:hypothetical protein